MCLDHRNVGAYLTIVGFCMLYLGHFMIACSGFPLTMLIIWPAILIYDYCLTFVAEVERCWAVRRLNWALVFFYLNRYLTILGYIPIMLEYFWLTSDQNKTEVSVLLLKTQVLMRGRRVLMDILPDVGTHPCLALENGH